MPSRGSRDRKGLWGVLIALVLSTGCGLRRNTWQDWVDTDASVSLTPASGGGRTVGGAVATIEASADPHAARLAPDYALGEGARAGFGFDLDMRNPDFPTTFIRTVHIDLTGPEHPVTLEWEGPLAALGPVGPFGSTPGRGGQGFDCDDVEASNTSGSLCTPKGVFPVAGFSDRLQSVPTCLYATWILHAPRFIAMHSHSYLPRSALSHGCVRLPYPAAKLIHNNSKVGDTLVHIFGNWEAP